MNSASCFKKSTFAVYFTVIACFVLIIIESSSARTISRIQEVAPAEEDSLYYQNHHGEIRSDAEVPLLKRKRRYANQEFSHARQIIQDQIALNLVSKALRRMQTPKPQTPVAHCVQQNMRLVRGSAEVKQLIQLCQAIRDSRRM